MKKNIYIVLFGLLLSMGITSCDNDTDLLFEETAAQRKTGAIKEYNDALKSSEHGWLFQYFPEETQKYGGYNFVVKFAENDEVTVWSENMIDLTQPETSTYNIISYGGPVLTFDTYNSIMHEFANPSASEYLGKGGDFEFIIMSNENNVMTVKGVKTGNTMRLTKMTETAEEYLTKAKVNSNFLAGASLAATVNGTDLSVILGNRQLTFDYYEKNELKSETVAFVFTDKGIRLYEPISILGIEIQDFNLNMATKQFVSIDEKFIIDILFSPIDFTTASWSFDVSIEADRSDAVKAVWDQAYDINAANYPSFPLITEIYLGQTLTDGSVGLTTRIHPYWVHYNLIFGGVKDHSDYLNISKAGEGYNWQFVTYFRVLVDMVADNAPYKTEMDDAENPTEVKLTSVANPDVWFILRK